ncbi:MAG: hypothetical protein ACK5N9_24820 [Pirellula sp.]|jgi:hypothetical protein
MADCFRLDDKITLLPVVHRSGNHARAVERWLLERKIDCIAVPLPPSFRESVFAGVEQLPAISVVIQAPSAAAKWNSSEWNGFQDDEPNNDVPYHLGEQSESENRETANRETANRETEYSEPGFGESHDIEDANESEEWSEAEIMQEALGRNTYSFVPIDPCQSVIAAIRFAIGERIPVRFIDMETDLFAGDEEGFAPDCYALSKVSLEAFSTAMLPSISRPKSDQVNERIRWMAKRLLSLRSKNDNIVMLCDIHHWPWIREAYHQALASSDRELVPYEHDEPAVNHSIAENTLVFMLSELPYITAVYEQSRSQLIDSPFDSYIDGIKKLLLSARASYLADFGKRARRISPFLLSQCLKYIRNLSLVDNRLTPDMYTILLAAKQTFGDSYAVHVAETIKDYAFQEPLSWSNVKMGIGKLELPDGEIVPAISRLGEGLFEWRSLDLARRPPKDELKEWQKAWNPYQQCSWLPEDAKIENFRTRVVDRAQAILGADLARSEKFTTSIMDGLDIRETLRHWHEGELYVKIQPPSIGKLDACILMFDPTPSPEVYDWRATWYAEYEWESTLAFYATNFHKEIIGPGIGVANYGAALFLFPPRSIPDIWTDRELKFADTLEDRIIAAACKHSRARQVALMSPMPPTVRWRQIAKQYGKSLVHVPMSQFGDEKIAELRTVHVLNGKQVRSYAAHFIRNI